eukprot:4389595-Pleurochrysis_carterae.AAC.1
MSSNEAQSENKNLGTLLYPTALLISRESCRSFHDRTRTAMMRSLTIGRPRLREECAVAAA